MNYFTVVAACFLVFFNMGLYIGMRMGGKIVKNALEKYLGEQFGKDIKTWASEMDE